MEEPARFRRDSMKHTRIPYLLIFRRYGVRLAAISFTWYSSLQGVFDLDASNSFHSLGFCMISSRNNLSLILLNPLTSLVFSYPVRTLFLDGRVFLIH